MTVRRNAAFAAIAALCLPLAASAVAQEREAVSATVTTADLNLASPEGVARLNTRVRTAIARACGRPATLADLDNVRRCRDEMTGDAGTKVAALVDRKATVRVASAR